MPVMICLHAGMGVHLASHLMSNLPSVQMEGEVCIVMVGLGQQQHKVDLVLYDILIHEHSITDVKKKWSLAVPTARCN